MVYDDQGEFMDNVPSENQRTYIELEQIPKQLRDAFISIEDERFETHNGIDLRRIAGAVLTDAKKLLKGERGFHGASTITQQVIKNTMLTNEVKLSRKIKEIYLSLQLENELSKEQILEAYLNIIPLGGTSYGVEAGSYYYFNKSCKELTLAESAYLAGVTQSPTGYNAFIQQNIQDPSRYINRTKTVLNKMLELEKVSTEEYNNAITEIDAGILQETFAKTSEERHSNSNKLSYEWFTRPVIDQVKEALMKSKGYTEEEAKSLLANGGLKIYSTMNRELQDYTQDVLNNDSRLTSISRTDENGISQPQASAVVMDYKTGQVKAMVGGRGEQPALSYNRAYDAVNFSRATGSSIKPLTVYSAGIDSGFATAATMYEDSPLTGSLLKEYGQLKNSPDRYSGYITLREAIRRSVNVYAVKLVYNMGKTTSAAYAEKFGIDISKDKDNLSSLALGEFNGATTYQMAAAYGVFGNGGVYVEPILFTKVVDRDGTVLLESTLEQRPVISPQAAYITYDLLKGPLTYTATSVNLGSMPVAGKTGTSTGSKNLWFSGLTPHYSAAVWVGTDLHEEVKGLGSNKTSGIWSKIMAKANEGLSTDDIPMPSGIVKASICSVSGLLPTDLCKIGHAGTSTVRTELFVSGTVPKELCNIHVQAEVNSSNNKLATENTPVALRIQKVFITRDYIPSVTLSDQQYVLPTEYDDTPAPEITVPEIPTPEIPTPETPGDGTGDPIIP